VTLRPRRLDEYIGQDKTANGLRIFIEAAKGRGEVLDHVLFYGPPALGKTTLGQQSSPARMDVRIKIGHSLPVRESSVRGPGGVLTTCRSNDVLFIDEVHRPQPRGGGDTLSAMEDFALDSDHRKGPAARKPAPQPAAVHGHWGDHSPALLTSPLRRPVGVTVSVGLLRLRGDGEDSGTLGPILG